jgi:hypothetical protein
LTDDLGDGDDGPEEGVLEDAPLEGEEEVCEGEKIQLLPSISAEDSARRSSLKRREKGIS